MAGLILLLTLLSSALLASSVHAQQQARFEREVDVYDRNLRERLDAYLSVLYHTRALWYSNPALSAGAFGRYVENLDLSQHYPGLERLGWAAWVPQAGLAQYRRQYASGAGLPVGRPIYVPLTYLQPGAGARSLLGYDLYADPLRRAAIDQAVGSGRPASTQGLALLSDQPAGPHGFVLYLPLYRAGLMPQTPQARRQQVGGLLAAPISTAAFLNGVYPNSPLGPLSLRISDSGGVISDARLPTGFRASTSLDVAGRQWRLEFGAPSSFGRDSANLLPWLTALVGLVLALVMFVATRSFEESRVRADAASRGLARSRVSLDRTRAEFAAVFRSMQDTAIFTDTGGRVQLVNDALRRSFGLDPTQLLGRPLAELYPVDGRPGQSYARFRRPDGQSFSAEVQRSEVRDESGALIGQLEVIRDVTERLEAERARAASEQRFQGVLEALPQLVWVTDAGGEVSYRNPGWYVYTGQPPGDPRTEAWDAALHPDDRARALRVWSSSLQSGALFEVEYRLRRHDGVYHWFVARASAIRDAGGRITEWVGVCTDISDQVYAEKSARLLAEFGRMLSVRLGSADNLKAALGLLTQDFAQLALLALPDSAAPRLATRDGLRARDGFAECQTLLEGLAAGVLTSGKSAESPDEPALERCGLRGAGALPVYSRGGELLGALLLAFDAPPDRRDRQLFEEVASRLGTALENERLLGQAREAERQLTELNQTLETRVRARTTELEEANRELEAFSYSVSHDLRTPLRHVVGFADLLRQDSASGLSEKSARYLGIIGDAAHRMSDLIDNLLEFSRMGRTPLRLQRVSIGALVAEARAELELGQEGHQVEWRVGALPTVEGDPNLLKLVMLNLLTNALKYSRKNDRSVITVNSEVQGSDVVVHVGDNGVGFDPRFTERLFGVFQRLHRQEEFEGTGIGLANVRRIVTRHGGRVWAESVLGQGARFSFSLPLPAAVRQGQA